MTAIRIFDPTVGDRILQIPGPVAAGGVLGTVGFASLVATADPGVNQDSTQGYGVGSIVFNVTAGALRWWECRDATPGAAKWVYSGADFANGGTNPNSEITQFGLSSALMSAEGNINRQISSAGVSPGGLAADNVVAVYALPAGSFDVLGRGISITAQGSIVSSANAKRTKIIFNPTTAVVGSTVGASGVTVADSGVIPTSQAGGWVLMANVFKYGAAGSNTQIGLHQLAQVPGAAQVPPVAPSLIAAVESGPILIAVVANVAVTATDIVFNFLEVNAMN